MTHAVHRLVGLVFLAATLAPASPAPAQGKRGAAPPDYGHDFVTVGAPGNRHMLPEERAYNSNFYPGTPAQIGRVDHSFRITRDVIRVEEWFEFVNVAWPIWDEWGYARTHPAFSSVHISPNNFNPASGPPGWQITHGTEDKPVVVGWRVAALYCNWLHNGRPTGPGVDIDLLRTGAYDISTFTRNPDGTFNDQWTRSPGAKYWIPDLHEWTKAVYYDPDRYGEGEDGYWLLPYSTNELPPYDGGIPGDGFPMETPWGLTNVMGVVEQWTETLTRPLLNEYGEVSLDSRRFLRSSDGYWPAEYNDYLFSAAPGISLGGGIRIASLVPAPGGATIFAFTLVAASRRGRRA